MSCVRCGRPSWLGRCLDLGRVVKSGKFDALPRTYSKELRDDVIGVSLQVNPQRRPSAQKLAQVLGSNVSQDSTRLQQMSHC